LGAPLTGNFGLERGLTAKLQVLGEINLAHARDPHIVNGQPVLRGTRVTLKTVLASLAEGATPKDILQDFPTCSMDDVRAAIAFAAASAQEDLPTAEIPVKR
jgi:uncharacterized protein (DUF433 family)